ncbi:hypothetical protein MATL_G00172670 [Megalops atlanticus]|uniref:Uncharacterized protein n=1 Tax=Megalops atlanticus TaxID=7932 RepID=A0A9D3PRB7_MEGAT|nr:hypothetical protein MATL_G00172670 [Megalops atlanticus]
MKPATDALLSERSAVNGRLSRDRGATEKRSATDQGDRSPRRTRQTRGTRRDAASSMSSKGWKQGNR